MGGYKTVFDEDWGTAEDEAKTARGNLGQGSAKAAQQLKFKMKPGPTGAREDAQYHESSGKRKSKPQ